MNWPFGHLQPASYRLILADPPWTFRTFSAKGEDKSPQAQYVCMDLPAIQALPVADLAHPEGCMLVMWGTAPMLPQALETMAAWGFTFKSAGCWAKQSTTGEKWAFGTGFIYRSASEFYITATRGKPKVQSRSVRNLIVAPVREHSRKPDQMHTDCEALSHGPYAELFARSSRVGWDVWGNQAGKFGASFEDILARWKASQRLRYPA